MHFHIRWTGVARLDWEPFGAREEAESRAKELVRPGELFAVEKYDETCKRCAEAFGNMLINGNFKAANRRPYV
jgi:hypothetical protein